MTFCQIVDTFDLTVRVYFATADYKLGMAGRRSEPTKTDYQITNVGTDSAYADH